MNETEITDRVNAFTEQDWLDLQGLYERVLAHKGSFSEMGGGGEFEEGVIEMPYTIEKPIVREVRQFFVDKHLQVMFDWSHWNEGKAMFRVNEADRFKNISLEDTVKLFTAILRNDRFNDGAWADLFENGDGQRLLKRLLDFRPLTVQL
jgi:hypothetical protein